MLAAPEQPAVAGVTPQPPAAAAAQAPPTLQLTDDTASGQRTIQAVQLDVAAGWTFWRFDLQLELTAWQRQVQYQISTGGGGEAPPPYTFCLPAAGQPMHWGYYSCNGFSASVKEDAPERQDPTYLWRDMLQLHSAFPLHCLVGGGDQLYCDGVFKTEGSAALKAWGELAEHSKKVEAPWTDEMEQQTVAYYCAHYIDTFSQADVSTALACIPQLNMWDDHDIFDGFGSYEADMQGCPVLQGLFGVARRFYLLFQQHTTDAFNAQHKEFLGVNDGSAFHYVRYMGPQVVLLGIDMRSQRSKDRILPEAAYELFEETIAALPPGPQHLVVLSGVPLIFPAVPAAEGILGGIARMARGMPRFRRLVRRTGLMDRFDQPEILDDLLDGWVANAHKDERLQFIRLLQRFSERQNLRVSILSGDAHVGGVGRLYSRPKIKPLGDDPLFMVQIISSAIMNAPPGHQVVKMLLRTNWARRVDERTKEKMVRAFYPTHPRTDKLIAQRNWCDISLVAPPFSPPTVPQDPNFGGLRFTLRVENAWHRRGCAEEVYYIIVPRHPAAPRALVSTGAQHGEAAKSAVPAAVALPTRRWTAGEASVVH